MNERMRRSNRDPSIDKGSRYVAGERSVTCADGNCMLLLARQFMDPIVCIRNGGTINYTLIN